ncbi:hypothetical protein [Bacteroides heparinolyticus]|uniref:hypothetical protein n=1 Tax=Prevotella heparinolytica TaxID=28113 RepID=UPI00359F422C
MEYRFSIYDAVVTKRGEVKESIQRETLETLVESEGAVWLYEIIEGANAALKGTNVRAYLESFGIEPNDELIQMVLDFVRGDYGDIR